MKWYISFRVDSFEFFWYSKVMIEIVIGGILKQVTPFEDSSRRPCRLVSRKRLNPNRATRICSKPYLFCFYRMLEALQRRVGFRSLFLVWTNLTRASGVGTLKALEYEVLVIRVARLLFFGHFWASTSKGRRLESEKGFPI